MTTVTDAMRDLAVADRSLIWNTDLVEALELDNLLGQAAIMLHSALYRTESRGPMPARISGARRPNG